jgi:hypothetical protein
VHVAPGWMTEAVSDVEVDETEQWRKRRLPDQVLGGKCGARLD